MKLVCSQAELNASLQLVSRAVASRPTHPVLANLLLTADAATGRLSLTGYDLTLGIQTTLPASVETSGAITLPARLLGDIVSRLSSDSPITLSSDENEEQLDLTSLSGSYQMRGLPADGWLRVLCTATQIGEDWFDEDHTVVDSTGRIVVQTRQLALVPAE